MQRITVKFQILLVCLLVPSILPLITIAAGNKKRVFYVSSSIGCDENPGTRILPKRTIRSITTKDRDGLDIRLKCGDLFFESVYGLSNSIIRSYGKGSLPVLCGFKILKNPAAWHYEGNSLWRLDMNDEINFAGFLSGQSKNQAMFNDIGCIYDFAYDKIYGHIVGHIDNMKKVGDIFTSDKYKRHDIDENTFRYLYFYSDSTLLKKTYLCFSTYENGICDMKSCLIKDIAVIGFACHGMCNMDGCIVEGCLLDIIGGSVQTDTPYWVRYGNGIEFWISEKSPSRNIVKNNIISRTYDCGVTIQGNSNSFVADAMDIHFVNNRFYHCRQAFEHFLNSGDTTCSPQYDNCEFTKNICFEMGENEFSSPEPRDANILSYDKEVKYLKIEKNVFYGSSYYCGRTRPFGMAKNKVFLYKGQYLYHFHGTTSNLSIYADNEKSVRKYKEWCGDNSKIIILEKENKDDKMIRKKIKKTRRRSSPFPVVIEKRQCYLKDYL